MQGPLPLPRDPSLIAHLRVVVGEAITNTTAKASLVVEVVLRRGDGKKYDNDKVDEFRFSLSFIMCATAGTC